MQPFRHCQASPVRLSTDAVFGIKQALFGLHRRLVTLPRAERVTETLAELAGPRASLLDVGAGDGAVAKAIGERIGATRVVGVDVLLRPKRIIEVVAYDGEILPFPDQSFEVVTICDVLHHCSSPEKVLAEALRVSSGVVVVKDHFRLGPVSNAILLAMDMVGNAEAGVLVRGTYFSPVQWVNLVNAAGGRITALHWPMRIHDAPMRFLTRDELQFAARIERVTAKEREI